jgi:hypothetical protein
MSGSYSAQDAASGNRMSGSCIPTSTGDCASQHLDTTTPRCGCASGNRCSCRQM